MAEVYKQSENVLVCYTRGLNYTGFLKGAEKELDQEPVQLEGGTLTPGDRIVGFKSGNSRTSFLLQYDYMTYLGKNGPELYFDIYDSKSHAKQGNLFEERPLWLLTFPMADPGCLLMFSKPGAGWDIRPREIIRFTQQ